MMNEQMILAVMAVGLVVFLLALAAHFRGLRRRIETKAEMPLLSGAQIEELASQISQKMGATAGANLATIASDVSDMRNDFDLLISERMIEQAITMAQNGQPAPAITRATGLNEDEQALIAKFRKH